MNIPPRIVTVWHRGKAKVNHLLGGAPQPPKTFIVSESTCRVPYEIVEVIIAHLIHDLYTLKACSLTCRSWYSIAATHIHHTLTLLWNTPGPRINCPELLAGLHALDLIRFVKEIKVLQGPDPISWFSPQQLTHPVFANIHTLKIQNAQIYRFLPGGVTPHTESNLGILSPTLRSIMLCHPNCTPRQLSHFFSLFPNLDDIGVFGIGARMQDPPVLNTEPIPFSASKLRGRLTVHRFGQVETWKSLSTSCGGLRFRHVDLGWDESCTPFLLEACAETVETLRFDLRDFWTDIGLSELKVLQSLQVRDWIVDSSQADFVAPTIVQVFSTITSPTFSELVLIVTDYTMSRLHNHFTDFEALRKMWEDKPFNLVFLLDVSDIYKEGAPEKLAEALNSATAKDSLSFLNSPPVIRILRPPGRPSVWSCFSFD